MKTLGTSIIINRGEVFSINREVLNDFGEPYILDKNWPNPYILLTVSSNRFASNGKYQQLYWLDLSAYPKFEKTRPEYISDLDNGVPSGYTADTAVFYTITDGERSYYRWTGTVFIPYSFKFKKTFLANDTAAWIESIYLYEIAIVSGTDMYEYLRSTFIALYPGVTPPDDKFSMWKEIYKADPKLGKQINYTSALASFGVNDVLLPPSKLIINTNI